MKPHRVHTCKVLLVDESYTKVSTKSCLLPERKYPHETGTQSWASKMSLTNLMQVHKRLLKPCPQKSRALRRLALVEQAQKCRGLVDSTLHSGVNFI